MDIKCLLSHKCSDQTHELGRVLREHFIGLGIELLVDPFRLSDDVETRIDSFDFEALLFLSCPESLASAMCQRELRTARRESVPVFVALLAGTIPDILKKRIYWSLPAADSPVFVDQIASVAQAIRARVGLARHLIGLRVDSPPDETRSAAEALALETDRSLLAENVSVLARRYARLKDPTTRFWLALALGSAGTSKAAKLLNNLPKEDHPYALEGIRQAREMIAFGS